MHHAGEVRLRRADSAGAIYRETIVVRVQGTAVLVVRQDPVQRAVVVAVQGGVGPLFIDGITGVLVQPAILAEVNGFVKLACDARMSLYPLVSPISILILG